MARCACSGRALEIVIKDLTGLTLRPRRVISPQVLQNRRPFATTPPLRLLESSSTVRTEDAFIPFDSDANAAKGGTLPLHSKLHKAVDARSEQSVNSEPANEDWHAEIELASSWPGRTISSPEKEVGAPDSKEESIAGHEVIANAEQIAESSPPVDPVARMEPHDPGATDGGPTAVPVPAEESQTQPQQSRAQSRLQRKLRRVEANNYRPRAQASDTEQHGGGSVQAILEKIENLDGPDVVSAKANTKRTTGARKKDGNGVRAKALQKEDPQKPETQAKKETWQMQKAALERKFGDKGGWQPRKRLSPDTLEGIRALHTSDPLSYTTPVLAKHFKVTPEAIRRILRSKWQPSEGELEDRKQRWEKRGVKRWAAMAGEGMRPPAKWRAMGVQTPQTLMKRASKRKGEKSGKDDQYLRWEGGTQGYEDSLTERIL